MKKYRVLLLALFCPCFLAVCQCQPRQLATNSALINKIIEVNNGASISRTELMEIVSALGESKEQIAASQISKLMLGTNDLAVGNACIMALSEIKAPETMLSIINFVENKPVILRRQGIIAARKIADKTAAGWLLANAYGHEDVTVRKEALDALQEVEAKLVEAKK